MLTLSLGEGLHLGVRLGLLGFSGFPTSSNLQHMLFGQLCQCFTSLVDKALSVCFVDNVAIGTLLKGIIDRLYLCTQFLDQNGVTQIGLFLL